MRKQIPGILIALVIFLASSCVSYEPDPINVAATARSFEEATPERALQSTAKELDLSDGVSVFEARLIALAQNPELLAMRKKIGIAEAQLVSAGIIPNPTFGIVWKNNTARNTGPNYEVEIIQSVGSLFNRGISQERAQAGLDNVRAQLAHQEWALLKEVEAAYFEVLYRRTALDLASQAVTLFKRVEEVAKKRVQAGDATKLDENLARIERNNARKDKTVAKADLVVAKQQLSRLLGLSPTYAVKIKDHVLESGTTLTDMATLQAYSLKHRMDLAGMLEDYEAAEKALQLAIRRQYPDFQIGPTYERESDGADLTGFGIELELPIFNQSQGEIGKRAAERAQLKSKITAHILGIQTEVAAAFTKYQANQELVKLFTDEVIPSLDESLMLLDKSLKAGEIDVLLVITSQEKVLRAWSSHVEAQRDLIKSRLKLEQAVGGDLERIHDDTPEQSKGE